MEATPRGELLVVMGVAGAAKTTVGRALAARLGLPYADADDFHPAANVAATRAGVPARRRGPSPLAGRRRSWLTGREAGGVESCSALRRSYRDMLRGRAPAARFVHLVGPAAVVARPVDSLVNHLVDTLRPTALGAVS